MAKKYARKFGDIETTLNAAGTVLLNATVTSAKMCFQDADEVLVSMTLSTAVAGKLDAWIDFAQDGGTKYTTHRVLMNDGTNQEEAFRLVTAVVSPGYKVSFTIPVRGLFGKLNLKCSNGTSIVWSDVQIYAVTNS